MIDTDIFDDVDKPVRGRNRPDAPASVIDVNIPPPAAATEIPLDIRRLINTVRGQEIFKIEDGETETPPVIAAEITTKPGQKMPDGTIYLGRYNLIDIDGVSLAKTFNVFAAPEDLPGTMKYVDTVKHIASLKNWHGYDGTNYASDKEIHSALKDGSYNGGWIIPPRDILCGKNTDSEQTTPDNILTHKNSGSFYKAFRMHGQNGSDFSIWYLSSTEIRNDPQNVWCVTLSCGDTGYSKMNDAPFSWTNAPRYSCRPVRLVEIKP